MFTDIRAIRNEILEPMLDCHALLDGGFCPKIPTFDVIFNYSVRQLRFLRFHNCFLKLQRFCF